MDAIAILGLVLVLATVVASVAAFIVVFYFLGRNGPKWSVLCAGALLFLAGLGIQPGDDRASNLLVGVLYLSGFMGIIFGLFELFRKRALPTNYKSWGQGFRDGLIASPGTLICALLLVIVDVVVDGNYMFSALVCPIWFLISVVRVIVWRISPQAAATRVLIPVFTGLLVVTNYSVQYNIAMGNAARLIQACEHYRESQWSLPRAAGQSRPALLEFDSKSEILLLVQRVRVRCIAHTYACLVGISAIRPLGVPIRDGRMAICGLTLSPPIIRARG